MTSLTLLDDGTLPIRSLNLITREVQFKNEILPLNGENGTSLPVAFPRFYRAEPYNADGNGSMFVGVVQILQANLVVLRREASRG